MADGFTWTVPPSREIIPNINVYARRVKAAVFAVAQQIATIMQNDAKASAPWRDRTGNARSGLNSFVIGAGRTVVEIFLAHGVFYGVYLELARGGRYAVIVPVINRSIGKIKALLQAIFG